jgi:cardiolipin synthase
MNLANLITIGRLILVPVIVWLLILEAYPWALGVFAVAALSDAADGWLARRLNAVSDLGRYLDPLADKVMLVSTYATLGVTHLVPTWLVITVISRDVLIVGGLLLARMLEKPVAIKPLVVSKANTLAQIGFMVLALWQLSFDMALPLVNLMSAYGVAALTIVSGIVYVRTWIAHMNSVVSP